MVHNIVTYVPETVGGEWGQKRDTTQDLVELTIWGKALMTGIMTQNKNAASNKACHQTKDHFEKYIFCKYGSGDAPKP